MPNVVPIAPFMRSASFIPIALGLLGLLLGGVSGCADPSADGACATERDCRPGQTCLDGRCGAAPACALDTDCPPSQICRARACGAQSCRDDDDCAGRRCLEGWCQPQASSRCADDDDCPAGACGPDGLCLLDVCPPTGCAAGCAADGDCPADGYCAADGLCRAGCRLGGCASVAGAASSAALCDPDSRQCVTVECAADADCPAEAWCDDRVCRPGCRLDPDPCPGRCDRETRRCGCAADGDCPADAFCADDGICRPGCRIGGCAEGACDRSTRRCAAPTCVRDADCGPDRACGLDDLCHPARGPLGVEAPCEQPAQCASGSCAEGRCLGRCAADGDCPSMRCVLVEAHLMCVPPPAVCAAEADCAEGLACRPWWGDGPPRLGCRVAVGEAAGSAPCADDSACGSGACRDGICWTACATDDDCPGACLPAALAVPRDRLAPEGPATLFAGCLDPALGSGALCADAGGCPDDEVCGLWATGAGFDGRCRAVGGAGAVGEACGDDGDCRGRWCADGLCVAPCVAACAAGACAEVALDDRRGGRFVTRICGAGGEEP